MDWTETPQNKKWWDICLPDHTAWGPIAMREDNAVLEHEMIVWLNTSGYPYNSGYEPTTQHSVDRNTGRKTWEFDTFVRLYELEHARRFTLVWT